MITTLDLVKHFISLGIKNLSPESNTFGPNDTYRIGLYKYASYVDPTFEYGENRYTFLISCKSKTECEKLALETYEKVRAFQVYTVINDTVVPKIDVLGEPIRVGLDDNKNTLYSFSIILYRE